ncbi:FAD-binding protein [Roseovarius spongiae]|uniref:FAD-binding protein n=1 Tax=Roseovarius spongiae TaxID=2320272 RepID=A0A3A8B725_9RHOB|nr:FAD-binding protein [Roseovarius spongiae]RKF17205.1 FAD-binding protein [Roseovarius spongiae]
MRPDTEAELADAIGSATGPIRVEGGGTRATGGGGAVLRTGGLSGITLYEPGALTMVARAGTPLAEVEAALAAEGQRLPFEPMDHRGLLGTKGEPTIGGVFAANVSGPRRIAVGAARDFLLGVRFVDGAGRIVANGGRVMKNVTGYDLVKLMAGSRGTLGVLSEVSFKVLPRPAAVATLRLSGLSDVDAVTALARALGSPWEVSGAAHAPDRAATLIRIEGSEASVRYRAGALQKLLAGFGAAEIVTDGAENAGLWAAIRDVAAFQAGSGDVWRLSVKPSDAPRIVAALPECRALYDWGGGLVWLLAPEGKHMAAIREAVSAAGGHATRLRGDGPGAYPPQPPAIAALEAGLRARFDPRGILNPGLMGD